MSAAHDFAPPIEPIARRHDRDSFDCGEVTLNDYLKRYALQNHINNRGLTFVAVESSGSSKIVGYYTLAAGSVGVDLLSDEDRKHLPRYPVPVAHLGRLAVDLRVKGKGLGKFLLVHALKRINRIALEDLAIQAVEVVALNAGAKHFYEKFGFTAMKDDEFHLYLSIKKLRKWLTT